MTISLRGTGHGSFSQVVAFYAAQADHRDNPMIPVMPVPAHHVMAQGWDDVVRGRQYRNRKAPRMAARRVSRRARERAKWSDAIWGVTC